MLPPMPGRCGNERQNSQGFRNEKPAANSPVRVAVSIIERHFRQGGSTNLAESTAECLCEQRFRLSLGSCSLNHRSSTAKDGERMLG